MSALVGTSMRSSVFSTRQPKRPLASSRRCLRFSTSSRISSRPSFSAISPRSTRKLTKLSTSSWARATAPMLANKTFLAPSKNGLCSCPFSSSSAGFVLVGMVIIS